MTTKDFWRVDLGYAVRFYDIYSHTAHFDIFNIVDLSEDKPRAERRGVTSPLDSPVESLDDAQPYASGFVKWDGCLEFSTVADQSFHLCGQESGRKLTAFLLAIWDMAATVIPAWNHEIADTKEAR